MRNITVFTGTRADYGILYWLLHELKQSSDFELQLLVSGSHLGSAYGDTYRQIEQDGFKINEKVDMLLAADSSQAMVKSMGLGLIGFADALTRLKPDLIVILGDRFEALAIAQAAMLMKIPIAHLHGGELTHGALDDNMRHAITKLSTLHLTSTAQYRQRVIQLGETPTRVHCVGALGNEHITRRPLMSLTQLATSLDFSLTSPFILATYHSVTLADECPVESISALLKALELHPKYQIIITYPNADLGGQKIIPLLSAFQVKYPSRVCLVKSLGQVRYLSAVKHAALVIGNSSSGLIEVPALSTPTINIGQRQKGRLAGPSVFHCQADTLAIGEAISKVTSPQYLTRLDPAKNPYGSGLVSHKIIDILRSYDYSPQKEFYDIQAH
ncbi:MAG: UDP-N-acetylglucosamine 2-epimerase (hydrolyzing) [Gammaproteobacteria bacterium]|nr:UDP-N-acetylglucosamine 2-epimerase (hydrolyzing) [Gammaproteobacteria bacterium]